MPEMPKMAAPIPILLPHGDVRLEKLAITFVGDSICAFIYPLRSASSEEGHNSELEKKNDLRRSIIFSGVKSHMEQFRN
jgi:hypothetical protein